MTNYRLSETHRLSSADSGSITSNLRKAEASTNQKLPLIAARYCSRRRLGIMMSRYHDLASSRDSHGTPIAECTLLSLHLCLYLSVRAVSTYLFVLYPHTIYLFKSGGGIVCEPSGKRGLRPVVWRSIQGCGGGGCSRLVGI